VGNIKLGREDILRELNRIFRENFEIPNPDPDANLREAYEFDSIDAIELLVEIEKMIGATLSQEDKKLAMEVRTLNDICDYIESMAAARA
jgi:acyl carrier protein